MHSEISSCAERNYAQIEKEGLSLIFGVRMFHKHLYGRHFILVTNHKSLLAILGSKKNLSTLAAAYLQRWAIFFLVISTIYNSHPEASLAMLMVCLNFSGTWTRMKKKMLNLCHQLQPTPD